MRDTMRWGLHAILVVVAAASLAEWMLPANASAIRGHGGAVGVAANSVSPSVGHLAAITGRSHADFSTKSGEQISDADLDLAEQTLATCPSDNPPNGGNPWPGLWANPQKASTGWTLAYDTTQGSTRMMVEWHTFYPRLNSDETWLVSDWAQVTKDQTTNVHRWTATLHRTKRHEIGGHLVGRVTMTFPSGAATRASVVWHWDSDNTPTGGDDGNYSGNECIYMFNVDAPAEMRGPSLDIDYSEARNPSPDSAPHGRYYYGIWFDPSSPGFSVEVADIDPFTEFNTLSIYDTNDRPIWLWAQIGPQSDWPLPDWVAPGDPQGRGQTQVIVRHRRSGYNMATTNCSETAACTTTYEFPFDANYYGRVYHSTSEAVVGLKVSNTNVAQAPQILWPPTDWPASSQADIAGCPKGTSICRPIKRQTDQNSLSLLHPYCDVPTPSGSCQIDLSWNASALATIRRIDANTSLPIVHAGDPAPQGVIGGSIYGSFTDTLSADERVVYQLLIASRPDPVMTVEALGAYSRVDASQPCVIPGGGNSCITQVTWNTPDEFATPNDIKVYRVQTDANGNNPTTTTLASGLWQGAKADAIARGTRVYYRVMRDTTELASSIGNPVAPVDASVTATPGTCSVPEGSTTCSTQVSWFAGAAQTQIFRQNVVDGSTSGPIASGASGSMYDPLATGSHVHYLAKNGTTLLAQSNDAFAITSTIAPNQSSCVVVAGQTTCEISIHWQSTGEAIVYRVDEATGTPTQVGGGFVGDYSDQLAVGAHVHYELKIAGALHAHTGQVTATSDTEGGDETTGAAESAPNPAGFVEPTLDVMSDRVGAIAGDFRVDESGNANYSVPIAVPAGAGNFSPNLSIAYNSGSGDGLMGSGFSLSGVSSITPCRPTVEAGDADAPSAMPDEFCLDGSRLILVSGQPGALNAIYRTEIESFQRVKIIRVDTPSVAGAARTALAFSVEGKDGSVRKFGGTGGTVFGHFVGLYSPLSGTVQAQGWLQTDLADAAGNAVTYTYTTIDAIGERYLQDVTWSGGRVHFGYTASQRTDVAYSLIGDRVQTQLLGSIEVRNPAGSVLHYYEPTYNNTASPSWLQMRPHLLALKECSSQGGACYPPTTFTWSEASDQIEQIDGSMASGLGYFQFGDLNGDKRGDLWWTSNASAGGRNNQLHVSVFVKSNGRPTPNLQEVFTDSAHLLPDGFVNGGLWETFDSDNDGRDDLLFAWANRDGSATPGGSAPNRMTWIRRLSTSSGLAPEETVFSVDVDPAVAAARSAAVSALPGRTPQSPTDLQLLGSSMMADVDGDGQQDLIFRAPDGKFWVAMVSPGTTSRSYVFTPHAVAFIDAYGLPVDDDRCDLSTVDLMRKEESYSQASDFDGDGRADLRFFVDVSHCGSGAAFAPEFFLSRGARADGAFVFQERKVFGDISIPGSNIGDAGKRLRTVDVNSDGLTDLIYQSDAGPWHYRLGGPSGDVDHCVANCTLAGNGESMQLLDFDGDGKLDFWFPVNRFYQVYLWGGSNWVLAPTTRGGIATSYHIPDSDTWVRTAADFDGDGNADNFFVKPSSGSWSVQRTARHHQPRGVVTQIVNGLGAKTTIDYAPLTFTSVYKRDYNAPYLDAGRGSPLFDVAAPTFVVRSVHSSAPVPNAPSAESRVDYRYAGLKVQGGGRGSVGFRRISTTDAQTQIEVDSYYLQAFPLAGLPSTTVTRSIGVAGANPCTDADADTCMVYVPLCAAHAMTDTCDDDLPRAADASTIIKETGDEWGWRNAAMSESKDGAQTLSLQGPIFVARTSSLSTTYDLQQGLPGGYLRSEETDMNIGDYDAYGNLLASTTTTSGNPDRGGDLAMNVVASTFMYDNFESTWKLGRLRISDVTTTHRDTGGTTTNRRRSSFTYDAKQLLASEKIAAILPNGLVDTDSPTVAKYYEYDNFGNKVRTSVCSASTVSEANCRTMTAGGALAFHPASATDVMRYSRTIYDASGRFVDKTMEVFATNATNDAAAEVASSSVIARNAAGDPTELTDVNGIAAKIRYGALSRKRYAWAPSGQWTRWDAAYCTGLPVAAGMTTQPCPSGFGLAYQAITTTAGQPTGRVFYDILGRPTLSLVEGFGSHAWVATITQYDASGNVTRTSEPFFVADAGASAATPMPGEIIRWNTTVYDAIKRPHVATAANGAIATIDYDGLKATTTLDQNESGIRQQMVEIKDGIGNTWKTIDGNAFQVEMRYDASGNAIYVNRGGTQSTTMTYDGLGRKKTLSDPDSGNWTYYVNDAGEVRSEISGRGTCVASQYDARGRLWKRSDYASGSCTGAPEAASTWNFDVALQGKGKLTSESNANVTRTLHYDGLGRTDRVTTTQDSKVYVDESTYDQFGRPFQHFFTAPGMPRTGERSVYTAKGHVNQLRSAFPTLAGSYPSYSEILDVDARGNVLEERGAPAAQYNVHRSFYADTGKLERQVVDSPAAGLLQDLWYTYDRIGNVTRRVGTDSTHSLTEDFHYDNLQRLVRADVSIGGQIVVSRMQSFDTQGNIQQKSDVSGTYAYGSTTGCPGGSTAHPHAVNAANGTTLCYDANGNVRKELGAASRTFDYTAADQVRDIVDTGHNTHVGFAYGPNRERARRLDYVDSIGSTANTIVHTAAGAEARWSATTGNSVSQLQEVRRYVGNVVIVQSGSGPGYRIKRNVVMADRQGSVESVLSATTLLPLNASMPTSFDAWGQRRSAADWTSSTPWTSGLDQLLRSTSTHGYTGHEMAESVGVIHMNGRIYDPVLARFLQADPFVQAPGDGQNWNRYSYVFNNPLIHTDPSGYWGRSEQMWLRTVAAIVITVYTGGAAAGAWSFLGTSVTTTAGAYAVVAVGGFAAGAIQTGTLRGAATGAVSAAAFYGIGDYFQGAGWAHETKDSLSMSGYAAKTLAHGAAGGVMSSLQGGNFGHGFASAAMGEAVSPAVDRVDTIGGRVAAAAVVGGTTSVVAGGKFANGAITAAFSRAFNEELHYHKGADGKMTARAPGDTPEASEKWKKLLYEVEDAKDHILPPLMMMSPELAPISIEARAAEAGSWAAADVKLVEGYYQAEGSAFKFSEYYYEKLWSQGRPYPFLTASAVLQDAQVIAPDRMNGYYKFMTEFYEMVYNPVTKDVWHLQPK